MPARINFDVVAVNPWNLLMTSPLLRSLHLALNRALSTVLGSGSLAKLHTACSLWLFWTISKKKSLLEPDLMELILPGRLY